MKKFVHIADVQRRIFAAMLSQLDDSVGRVLATVRESGLEENTLVVLVSDNGGPTKELTSSNAPLRGGKGELWEGGVRVPLIASWKGHVAAGRTVDVPVSSMDATVTALELAGAATGGNQLDGASLLPLLAGKSDAAPHDALFWRVGKQNALRRGDWKLVRDGGAWKLFNLAADVGETVDLAAKEPTRVQELDAIWTRWNAEQVAPLWK
ncbi:MAG TPA: sulfatase-like hydrolase/transferase [Pirellulales bacterium]|nr:sulfatase-like hydrolase/transferase [Pirellulales bacterium]